MSPFPVSQRNEVCGRLNRKHLIARSAGSRWRWRIPFDRSVHVNLRRKTADGQRARGGIAQLSRRGNSAPAGMQKPMRNVAGLPL